MTLTTYSQYGQDKLVLSLLNNKREGVFIDIGAHDGITLSNTYLLEKGFGWQGFCFEPNPIVFTKLKQCRTCVCENKAIGKASTSIPFMKIEGYSEMLSGVVDSYSTDHLRRIDEEIAKHGGDKEIINIESVSLGTYMTNINVFKIDYLSIDTEGNEHDILHSIDFDSLKIGIITVENNYKDNRLRSLLSNSGFRFLGKIGCDDIFIGRHLRISALRLILIYASLKISSIFSVSNIKKAIVRLRKCR